VSHFAVKAARVTIALSVVAVIFYAQNATLSSATRYPATASEIADDASPDHFSSQPEATYVAAHAAGKTWTQEELLARAKELAATSPHIRVDVFRVFESRSNEGELLERRAIFPEVTFYSERRESHSIVYDPTPVEFMAVWVNDQLEFVFAVSSATYRKRFVPARDQWEHPTTPSGAFAPIYLNPLHHSKTYRPVGADIGPEMPFSVFIDNAGKDLLKSWSGYAFHGTTLSHYDALGTPDSGGCIRMAREDAEVFFALLNPELRTLNRYGRWYADRDPRNRPSETLTDLRERMRINIIDPDFMEANPDFAAQIHARYENLLSYIYIEVNNNIDRTLETLKSRKHRTLTETAKSESTSH
jgi:hypothetical protein